MMKAKVVKVNKKGSNKVAFNMEDGSKIKVKIGGKKYRRIVAGYEFTEEAKAQLESILKVSGKEKFRVLDEGEPVYIYPYDDYFEWYIRSFGCEEFMNLVKEHDYTYIGISECVFGTVRVNFEEISGVGYAVGVIYQRYAYNYIKEHCQLYMGQISFEKVEEYIGFSDNELKGHLEEFKESGVIVDVSLEKSPTGEGGFYGSYYSVIFQKESGETVEVSLMGEVCDYIMKNCKFSPEAREKLSEIEVFSRILFTCESIESVSLSSEGKLVFETKSGGSAEFAFGGDAYNHIVIQRGNSLYNSIGEKFEELELANFVRCYREKEIKAVSRDYFYGIFEFEDGERFSTRKNSLTYYYIMGNLPDNDVGDRIWFAEYLDRVCRLDAEYSEGKVTLSVRSTFKRKEFLSELGEALDLVLKEEQHANELAEKYQGIEDFSEILKEVLGS